MRSTSNHTYSGQYGPNVPQRRGWLTAEQEHRLATALRELEKAKRERDHAVAAALKSGASIREIANFTGMSTRTVQEIGHANGWPTAAQRREWEDQRRQREQWRQWSEPPEQSD